MDNLIGQDVGRYHIIEQLGTGGMAVVYKANDTRLESEVAIKFIRRENVPPEQWHKMLKRFEQEAKRMAKFTHPNIVKVIDYGEHNGTPYLVMPYLPGGTLRDKMAAPGGKGMDYRVAISLLTPIAHALEYAHKRGTIHRDIKPSNILLTEEGQPLLTDFGVAKILDIEEGQTLTGTGVGLGTPKYMAPEQWQNQISVRTDIYALGVVLYEMVTGRVPYDAETPAAVLVKQVTEPLPRPRGYNPDIPEAVENILFKTLAKEPLDRYADVGEFAAALEHLAKNAGTLRNKMVTQEMNATADSILKPATIIVSEPEEGKKISKIGMWIGITGFSALIILIIIWVGTRLMTEGRKDVALLGFLASPTPQNTATLKNTPTRIVTPIPQAGEIKTNDKDGMEMVYVPEGEFSMGSENGDSDEKPVHQVYLDGYWIYMTEVTNGMYSRCVSEDSCRKPHDYSSKSRNSYYGNITYKDYPVIWVNWGQAYDYCAWAGGRLPSEAEWEKAARGTDGRTYPWGEGIDCGKANYHGKEGIDDCIGNTTEVGNYLSGASSYGALDMAGNVWEWVNDWYGQYYYANSPQKNPPGPSSGERRVLRSGSWGSNSFDMRSSNRYDYGVPDARSDNVGFRCLVSQGY